MATRKNEHIAASIGTISADYLETLLADPRFTVAQVAAIASTTPARLTALLAEPAPLPLPPRNWTSSPAVGTVPPYVGVATIPYAPTVDTKAGPMVGYTYGAPVPARGGTDFS